LEALSPWFGDFVRNLGIGELQVRDLGIPEARSQGFKDVGAQESDSKGFGSPIQGVGAPSPGFEDLGAPRPAQPRPD